VQPKFRTPDSKIYPLYRSIKNMLSSHVFMQNGGILGFHCAYQYPQTFEGTYYYERYPLTLKGTDAVLFTIFREFDLTVHIKAYEGHCHGSVDHATKRCRGLIPTQENIRVESEGKDVSANTILITANQTSDFECGDYVGDEIFQSVVWFNELATQDGGKGYHEVAGPVTNWIGNETEIDWEYAFLALLVVVPEFPKRKLKD